jgi:hypothetical protein
MSGKAVVERFKRCGVFGSDGMTRLARQIGDNAGGIGLRQ